MSEKPPLYVITATQFVPDPDGLTEWERKLLDKIRQLRHAEKRVMIFVDGARLFVFEAAPRGTIALE